jgi:excisionase family DNA binding protein
MGKDRKRRKRTHNAMTTAEAAVFLRVSNQTANRYFDSGKLKGHYVPGSSHRRITVDSLVAFMRENDMPEEWIKEVQ